MACAIPRRSRAARATSANVPDAPGERPRDAERQHHAALHVGRPRAVQPLAVAAQRRVRVVADHRVDVARAAAAGPRPAAADPRDQVRRAAGRRARHALDLGLWRQQRGTQRRAPPRRPSTSPDGEEIADERLELALRACAAISAAALAISDERVPSAHRLSRRRLRASDLLGRGSSRAPGPRALHARTSGTGRR